MTTVLAFIVVLGVLIFFHELGHFLAARLCGVAVEKFSLGFGPRLCGKTVGITDYRLSAIPLGGYVKMVGDEPDAEVAPELRGQAFVNKSVGCRAVIVAAGPLFNILLALLIYTGVYALLGVTDVVPVIRNVLPDSPARQAGIRAGDRVVSLDGTPVISWQDILSGIENSGGDPVTLTIRRNGRERTLQVRPTAATRPDVLGDPQTFYDIGIGAFPEPPAVVGQVSDDSPAAAAGLASGDRIAAIDGEPIDSWNQMSRIISDSRGRDLTMTLVRGPERFEVTVAPRPLGGEPVRYVIGITAEPLVVPPDQRLVRRLGLGAAVTESVVRTVWICELTMRSIAKMISGAISPRTIGGPIMIAQVAGAQARQGIDSLLQLIAFVSINLAFFNLLPIPVLDGGHLLFFGLEALLGKPVSLKVRERAHQVGFMLLVLLMLFVIYNDLSRHMGNAVFK